MAFLGMYYYKVKYELTFLGLNTKLSPFIYFVSQSIHLVLNSDDNNIQRPDLSDE